MNNADQKLWAEMENNRKAKDTLELRKVLDRQAVKIWLHVTWGGTFGTLWLFEKDDTAISVALYNIIEYRKMPWKSVGFLPEFNDRLSGKIMADICKLAGTEVTKDGCMVPMNNDGLKNCRFCGAPTKHIPGFISFYDICTKCGR